ncbi:MAG: hypothetical protein KF914_11955 [Rhizobiaceae bacterium]|nr:hypothetical protein [Rhizobiaceae bacterium]
MIETKPWYLSRTVWASLVAIVAAGLGMVGAPADAVADPALVDAILKVVAAIAGVVSLVGRLKATSRIK